MKKRILVIDDEHGFARLLKEGLESVGGYEVRVEHSGAAGLAALRTFRPDLILLDIVIPDMAGSDIAIRIKETDAFRNIPIIFLTATALREETEKSGGTIGGQPFLAKPVTVSEVITEISLSNG